MNSTIELNHSIIEFIQNSTIRLVSNGSYGITFEITSLTELSTLGQQKILMKLCIIDERNVDHLFKTQTESFKIWAVSSSDFERENTIHKEIYDKSIENSQPLCPKLFSYYLLPKNDLLVPGTLLNFVNNLIVSNPELSVFFSNTERFTSYGITFMEFLDGYETLFDIKQRYVEQQSQMRLLASPNQLSCENDYLKYVIRTMTGLIELALLGYNHGDFHIKNIMFQKSTTGNQNYYPGLMDECGRIMFIDFGQTTRIAEIKLNRIKKAYDTKDYFTALSYIYNSSRANGVLLYNKEYSISYKYITGLFSSFHNKNETTPRGQIQQQINTLIDIVIQARLQSSEEYVKRKYNFRRTLTREQLMSLKELKDEYDRESEKLKNLVPCQIPQGTRKTTNRYKPHKKPPTTHRGKPKRKHFKKSKRKH